MTSSDQKSVINFLKTQKDAINREISTIAFIFGATFHQTPRGCKVRAPQSRAPQGHHPVLKGLRSAAGLEFTKGNQAKQTKKMSFWSTDVIYAFPKLQQALSAYKCMCKPDLGFPGCFTLESR